MREQRLVFGEDAELYHRARPSYPDALVDDLLRVAGVGTGSVAVDVGCGTGKAAVLLAARGLDGVGVEPDPAMAAVARRVLAPYAGWRVDEDDFEHWGGPDGCADLVTAAQAWHWVDAGTRLDRARRALRPGGWLALWWNRPSHPDPPLGRALHEVYERLAPDVSARAPGSTRAGDDDDLPPGAPYGEVVKRGYRWGRSYPTAAYLDLLRTQSNHRLLDPGLRERLYEALGTVIDAHGGSVAVSYESTLWMARAS